MLTAALLGLAVGFISAMPPDGPAGALVIDRALSRDTAAALLTGVGSALAEAIYAALAFLGLSAWLGDLAWFLPLSEALAAAILLIVGLALALRRAPSQVSVAARRPNLHGLRHLALGFGITAFNPTLIITWAAFTTLLFSTGLVSPQPGSAALFGVGVGTGVALWYLVVTRLITHYHSRIPPGAAHKVTRAVGWLLVVTSVVVAVRFGLSLL